MWELDYKESWALKNLCFCTVVLEKSPLDGKGIQPVHPKGNQSWIFIGRTDAEAETLILGPPAAKNWLIWKDPDAGKHWGQEEKWTTEDEDEMDVGLGGLWDLVLDREAWHDYCSWGHKESDTTERLNWITKKTRKNCWGGCREKGSLAHCWQESKLVQSLWKTTGGSLSN